MQACATPPAAGGVRGVSPQQPNRLPAPTAEEHFLLARFARTPLIKHIAASLAKNAHSLPSQQAREDLQKKIDAMDKARSTAGSRPWFAHLMTILDKPKHADDHATLMQRVEAYRIGEMNAVLRSFGSGHDLLLALREVDPLVEDRYAVHPTKTKVLDRVVKVRAPPSEIARFRRRQKDTPSLSEPAYAAE